jgi:hypothetical protein
MVEQRPWETPVEMFRTISERFAGQFGTHMFHSSMRICWDDPIHTKKDRAKSQRSFTESALEPVITKRKSQFDNLELESRRTSVEVNN